MQSSGTAVGTYPVFQYYDALGHLAYHGDLTTWGYAPFPPVAGHVYGKYYGRTLFMHTDVLGSTGVTTWQDGTLGGSEIFDAWGQRWASSGTLWDERFASIDNVRDPESGLDQTPNRMLNSTYGRWLTPDPLDGTVETPQSWNKYAYVLNNPLRFTDPTGLYEEDVHQELTTVLAEAAGFSDGEAKTIGNADQRTDDDPATTWDTTDGKQRLDWHFTSPARRDALWNIFEGSGNLNDLGRYLHTEQDSFSHSDMISAGRSEHIREWTSPDKTYNDPAKADRMAEDTYNRLVTAASRLKISGSNRVGYEKIAGLVKEFDRARSTDQKRNIIAAIATEIRRQREEQKKQLTAIHVNRANLVVSDHSHPN